MPTTTTWSGTTSVTVPASQLGHIVFNFDPAETLADIRNADGSVVFTTQDGHTLVITGVQLSDIALGDITIAGGGEVWFGDGTSSTLTDNVGNTIDISGTPFGIAMGLGGSDTINAYGSGNHLVFGGSAAGDSTDSRDVINTGTGSDVVYGNAGDDTLYDQGGVANELYGGSGNDDIYADSVVDFEDSMISGGLGSDSIYVDWATGDLTVYGGNEAGDPLDAADDIEVYSHDGETNIYGNGGNDTIYAEQYGTGETVVYGGQGDDSIDLYGDASTTNLVAIGGRGADTINVDSYGDATVYGGNSSSDTLDSSDTITVAGHGGLYTVYGNGGEDDITVNVDTTGSAEVYGGADDDTLLVTGAATDSGINLDVSGGLGADDITVSSDGTTTIYGGNTAGDPTDGGDTITVTGAGQFDVYGNGGADTIDVSLSGIAGSAAALVGNANIYGGQGEDDISISGDGTYFVKAGLQDDTINVDLNASDATYTTENALVFGNEGADTFNITFDSTGDTGTPGDAMTVIGDYDHGEGDVVNIEGVTLASGAYLDIADANGNGTMDVVIGDSSGTDVVVIDNGADEYTQVDFSDGSFVWDGSAESNDIVGTSGDDFLIDASAYTGYFGVTGDGELPDNINGGAGDDVIVGGIAGDNLTGGTGDDTFLYVTPLQSTLDSYDNITDFTTGSDTIDLTQVVNGTPTFDTKTGDYSLVYDSLDEAVNALTDGDGSTDSNVITFSYGGESYVLVDNSANADFDEADLLIHLNNDAPIAATDLVL